MDSETDRRWNEAQPVFKTEEEEEAFEIRLRIKAAPRLAKIAEDEAISWCRAAQTFIV